MNNKGDQNVNRIVFGTVSSDTHLEEVFHSLPENIVIHCCTHYERTSRTGDNTEGGVNYGLILCYQRDVPELKKYFKSFRVHRDYLSQNELDDRSTIFVRFDSDEDVKSVSILLDQFYDRVVTDEKYRLITKDGYLFIKLNGGRRYSATILAGLRADPFLRKCKINYARKKVYQKSDLTQRKLTSDELISQGNFKGKTRVVGVKHKTAN